MKVPRQKLTWTRRLLLVCLAVLCIGGAELIACRIAAPALYARITEPVFSRLRSAYNAATDTLGEVSHRISDAFSAEEEVFPSQLAGETPSIPSKLPIEDPEVTQFVWQDGGNYLTGGTIDIRFYQQSAPEWAEKKYGRDPIGPYGCGPTAMAMAVSSLTTQAVDPEQMAQWAFDNGYWVSRSGSRLSIIEGAAKAHGLVATPLKDRNAQTLLLELSSGKLAVALMTTGHFTSNGHFILLRGATLSGKVLVADPNSLERSLIAWDPQLIIDELSPSRDAGAPLWLLSPAES